MNLNDYFLAKCFKKMEYSKAFDNGNIRFGNVEEYWNSENKFQQDKEGEIFSQINKGYIVKTKSPDFEHIIKNASNFQYVEKAIKDDKICNIIGETSDFSMKIEGYLCCFYLLPKKDIKAITNNEIEFIHKKTQDDFENFIVKYIEELKKEEAYVSIYDAYPICKIICDTMKQRGYDIMGNMVTYKNLSIEQKVELFQNRKFSDLIFTKSLDFEYQNEYRLFVSSKDDNMNDHITETGIDITSTIIAQYNCVP